MQSLGLRKPGPRRCDRRPMVRRVNVIGPEPPPDPRPGGDEMGDVSPGVDTADRDGRALCSVRSGPGRLHMKRAMFRLCRHRKLPPCDIETDPPPYRWHCGWRGYHALSMRVMTTAVPASARPGVGAIWGMFPSEPEEPTRSDATEDAAAPGSSRTLPGLRPDRGGPRISLYKARMAAANGKPSGTSAYRHA